jgi:PPE-SVP subfamily C-terminal region
LVSNLQTLLIVSGKLPRQINDDSPAGVALVGLPLFHIGTIQMDMDYFTSSQVVSTVPSTLQSLTSGSSALSTLLSTPVSQALEPLFGAAGADAPYLFGPLVVGRSSESLVSPLFALVGEAPAAAASDASAVPEGGLGTLVGSYGSEARGAGVSAGLGQAASVGALSVPQSWGTAAPAIRLAATGLPSGGLDGLPQTGAAGARRLVQRPAPGGQRAQRATKRRGWSPNRVPSQGDPADGWGNGRSPGHAGSGDQAKRACFRCVARVE